jgi:hypothetical protein
MLRRWIPIVIALSSCDDDRTGEFVGLWELFASESYVVSACSSGETTSALSGTFRIDEAGGTPALVLTGLPWARCLFELDVMASQATAQNDQGCTWVITQSSSFTVSKAFSLGALEIDLDAAGTTIALTGAAVTAVTTTGAGTTSCTETLVAGARWAAP